MPRSRVKSRSKPAFLCRSPPAPPTGNGEVPGKYFQEGANVSNRPGFPSRHGSRPIRRVVREDRPLVFHRPPRIFGSALAAKEPAGEADGLAGLGPVRPCSRKKSTRTAAPPVGDAARLFDRRLSPSFQQATVVVACLPGGRRRADECRSALLSSRFPSEEHFGVKPARDGDLRLRQLRPQAVAMRRRAARTASSTAGVRKDFQDSFRSAKLVRNRGGRHFGPWTVSRKISWAFPPALSEAVSSTVACRIG